VSVASGTPEGAVVDVCIPTYGRPEYLALSIESVLAQTLTSWRLTVSENGSGGGEIQALVERYRSDPRVEYVATGTNIGGAANSTRLIRAGSAPYVAVLHDDDLWGPGFLARRVEFMEANPSCGLVFSSSEFIDEAGKVLYRFEVDLPEGIQDRTTFLRRLYVGNIVSMPTVLVRRSSYAAVGSTFNESLLFYDHEMWLRIASRFDVGFM
jgi:GT2 family glycosyltransferase